MTTTTISGVANTETEIDGLDAAADAFLAQFPEEVGDDDAVKKKQPSEKTVETKDKTAKSEEKPEAEDEPETSDESPEETETEEADDETDEKPATKKYVDDDETYVKVKVGDQELEVPVKDLKRLHGQEAALTRKSQELAETRKQVDAAAQRHAAGLDALLKRAEAKANDFRKINFLALTKDPNINADQLAILQDEARKAFEEETFLKNELGTFVQEAHKAQMAQTAETAKLTVKTLSDPTSPFHIEGFNKDTYNNLLTFAVAEGLDKDVAHSLVDAPVFKLLHMAMSYKEGLKKVAVTKKVDKTPKKIVKTSSAPASQSLRSSKEKETMAKLRSTGTQEAATDAFLARLEANAPQD